MVGATDGFEAIHNAAGRLAGLYYQREREHEFYDDEKFINSVNGTDFKGAIAIRDMITGEKECRIVVKEVIT
jgi:hypothetical protein